MEVLAAYPRAYSLPPGYAPQPFNRGTCCLLADTLLTDIPPTTPLLAHTDTPLRTSRTDLLELPDLNSSCTPLLIHHHHNS